MIIKRGNIVLIMILLSGVTIVNGQESRFSIGPWSLKNISGELGIKGLYQDQTSTFNSLVENQNSTYLIGGLRLNTDSYLWQPDIISLSVGGEYNPETRKEQYLSIPDRSEVRTLKKLGLRTTIFSNKPLSLTSWFNYDQNYYNRENLTNIRSENQQWGGMFSINNKFLPLNISYRSLNWNQVETESGRIFKMQQNSILGRASKNFGDFNKNDFNYTYDDYLYAYSDLNIVSNKVHRASLKNQFFFDPEKKYSFQSHISYYDQKGDHAFNKFDASEQVLLRFKKNLDFVASYNFYSLEDSYQWINTSRFKSSLRHQLYESLSSEIFFDLSSTLHSVYKESNVKTGTEFRYTKKVAFGRLNIGYRYFQHDNSVESEQTLINIINETHSLNAQGIFLDKPYVEITSVLIKDISGTRIFEEGLDYILESINNFVSVQRIPGGQIEEGQEIQVSYSAIQPGTYSYRAHNHSYSASFSIFNKLLEVYYRGASQDFNNIESSDYLTMDMYTQNVYGGRFYFKSITGGVEFDNYSSSIIPYQRINYYLSFNLNLSSKILVSLNSSLRDYKLIGTDVDHQYTNISGRIAYSITSKSKINLQTGYLSQKGKSIDLQLLTGQLEYIARMRKFYFKTGLNLYNRAYSNSSIFYFRTYIQLTRKF